MIWKNDPKNYKHEGINTTLGQLPNTIMTVWYFFGTHGKWLFDDFHAMSRPD